MNAPTSSLNESQLREQLLREGFTPERWSNGPHAIYPTHDHPYGKILVVAEGSITFTVGKEPCAVSMKPGDRLELAPHTPHSARVGPDGVVCFEAHMPPANR